MVLDPVGVIAAVILFINTGVAAFFASRNRLYAAAYRWRKRMEPVHLDLLDWSYDVQMWAVRTGQRKSLPPLPESLQGGWLEEEDPDIELAVLKRQVKRHHERDSSP